MTSSQPDRRPTRGDEGDVIAGLQPCGCVTYLNCRPDDLDRDSKKTITDVIASGGQILRKSLEEVRAMPDFLPSECPHEPKGWEYTPPQEPDPKRPHYKRVQSRNLSVVRFKIGPWKHAPGGVRAGEVGKRNGEWWATTGWLDSTTNHATDGQSPRGPHPVLGPFKKRAEAAAALYPEAEAKVAEWDTRGAAS